MNASRVLLQAVLVFASGAVMAECGAGSKRTTHQEVARKSVANPKTATLSISVSERVSGRSIVASVDKISATGLLVFHVKNSQGLTICSSQVKGGETFDVGSFDNEVRVEVIATPGASAGMTIYSLGKSSSGPDRPAVPAKVRVPVEVHVFPSAPLAQVIRNHTDEAAKIWAKASIVLDFSIKKLDDATAAKLLGSKKRIETYLGCVQRFDEPGYAQRVALRDMKSNASAMAVFVAENSTQSQAEVEFKQAYLAHDLAGAPVGRTLAHEIGHLLLGEGHTGGKRPVGQCITATTLPKEDAPWTSGLMAAGNAGTGTDLSTADAATARKTALTFTGATWW